MALTGWCGEFKPANGGDGPALTAASAASCLPVGKLFKIPAFSMKLGTRLVIGASGRISSVITTPGTARFDIRIGGAIVFDSLAILLETVAAHVTVPWFLNIELIARSGGGFGTKFFPARCWWMCEDIVGAVAAPAVAGLAILPWNVAPAIGGGFDNSVDANLDMFFTQTAATGSLTVHDFSVELKNDANI